MTCVAKYGTRIPPDLVHTPPDYQVLLLVPSNGASHRHGVPDSILRPASHQLLLILICIKKHPQANDNTRSGSVSLESALTTPASQALVAHNRMEMLAALTSPSAATFSFCPFLRALPNYLCITQGTCTIWHRPPSASSPCPAISKVEAASESRAGLARQMCC